MSKYAWNPIFNLIMEIKKEYQRKFKEIFYTYQNGKSCVELWIEKLNNTEYINIFKNLKINQEDELILIKYKNYYEIFKNEETEITELEDFWGMHDEIYLECRGISIDIAKETIVTSPLRKFMSLGESEENTIKSIQNKIQKAQSIEITNKLDGSLYVCRYVPEYDRIISHGSFSLDENKSPQLKQANLLLNCKHIRMMEENTEFTFMFEYISPDNTIVIEYTKESEGIYLIGMRNVYSGEQLSYRRIKEYSTKYDVPMTEIFDKTFDEILQDIKVIKSNEAEGFVVNIDGHMIKVKAENYVEMHKLINKSTSVNVIIKKIDSNTYDDLVGMVPKYIKDIVENTANTVYNYINYMETKINYYYTIAPKNDTKEFMLWVSENVPNDYKKYVIDKYKGIKYSVISKGPDGHKKYKKIHEMELK